MRYKPPRVSYDQLESYLKTRLADGELEEIMRFVSVEMEPDRLPPTLVARWCGVDRQSIYRWRTYDIPYWSADRLAVRLGEHPLGIWPEYYAMEEALCT